MYTLLNKFRYICKEYGASITHYGKKQSMADHVNEPHNNGLLWHVESSQDLTPNQPKGSFRTNTQTTTRSHHDKHPINHNVPSGKTPNQQPQGSIRKNTQSTTTKSHQDNQPQDPIGTKEQSNYKQKFYALYRTHHVSRQLEKNADEWARRSDSFQTYRYVKQGKLYSDALQVQINLFPHRAFQQLLQLLSTNSLDKRSSYPEMPLLSSLLYTCRSAWKIASMTSNDILQANWNKRNTITPYFHEISSVLEKTIYIDVKSIKNFIKKL